MTSSDHQTTFPTLPVLLLIFVTLKLTGHIDWSWFWVLSPLTIPMGVLFVLLALVTALEL